MVNSTTAFVLLGIIPHRYIDLDYSIPFFRVKSHIIIWDSNLWCFGIIVGFAALPVTAHKCLDGAGIVIQVRIP
jgi:hypothetical protein